MLQFNKLNQELYSSINQANKTTDSDTLIRLGIAALNNDRLGYAMAFFKLALKHNHPNAQEFILHIQKFYR